MTEQDFEYLYLRSLPQVDNKFLKKLDKESEDNILASFQKLSPANKVSRIEFNKWRENFVKILTEKEIHIIKYDSDSYPESLRNISNYPKYLFAKGNISLLQSSLFAVVGTRNPTSYGVINAKNFTKRLVSSGFSIISGMAAGIDSISHKESLEAGTIAVMGCGVDVIYPAFNRDLYNNILKNNGLILSEYLPGTTPYPGYFPQRSRIIAALCNGLLVIEAAEKSGSLIAANLAFEFNKNIYAIPADITRVSSQGCNQLISKDIAKLVYKPEQILEDFNVLIQTNEIRAELKEYEAIINALKEGISSVEDLSQRLYDTSDILTKLTELELLGVIEKIDSEIYLRV